MTAAPVTSPEALLAQFEAGLRLNDYMGGQRPFMQQAAFLLAPHKEVLYGGSTKGGKSSALLMAALQYVDVPYYNALIIHRTFTDLSKGDALIPRFREWTDGKGVKWDDENHAGIFPSGAKVSFGFIDTPGAERRYKGPNYQFIGWEELTEQPFAAPYTFLFSRLSRPAGSAVPLRIRGTTNPDGPGHDWVKLRWGLGHDDTGAPLPPPPPSRHFIPSSLDDNPYVDRAEVEVALKELDEVTYAQVRQGNWDVQKQGDLFFTERVRVVEPPPERLITFRCRAWDKAGTDAGGAFTVGLRMARMQAGSGWPDWVVEDIVRGQWSSERREAVIAQTMQLDPLGHRDAGRVATLHLIEQEPGSGGKESAELTVKANPGIWIEIMRPTGDKITRVRPFSAQVNAYNVGIVRAPWNGPYLAELAAAPHPPRWDQLDTSGMAHNRMALMAAPAVPVGAPATPRTLPSGWR